MTENSHFDTKSGKFQDENNSYANIFVLDIEIVINLLHNWKILIMVRTIFG